MRVNVIGCCKLFEKKVIDASAGVKQQKVYCFSQYTLQRQTKTNSEHMILESKTFFPTNKSHVLRIEFEL